MLKIRSLLLMVMIVVTAVFVAVVFPVTARSIHEQQQSTYKVIAPPGSFDTNQPGVTFGHDYGAYALYRVSGTALNRLPAAIAPQIRLAENMDTLHLIRQSFDTQQAPPEWALQSAPDVALSVVQFVGPVKSEWLTLIRQAGAEPIHYVANNGYLVWADATARQRLDQMVEQGDILQFNAVYPTSFKTSAVLERQMNRDAGVTAVAIVIQMIQHPNDQRSKRIIENLLIETQSDWQPIMNFQTLYGQVDWADLPAIAQLSDVYWIGEQPHRELQDEVQGQILAGDLIMDGAQPAAPGYLDWLDSYGFSQNPADYPIVDVVDDGIGNGSTISGDPTLHERGTDANPSRLAYINNCTNDVDGSGVDGHGHINVSIAGGYDLRSGAPYQDDNGYQRGLGISPYGRFAGTRIFSTGGFFNIDQCGSTDDSLIATIYQSGAQISSNSWGDSSNTTVYDQAAQLFDQGVRDADLSEPGNQPLIMVFSAGNSGSGASTIGSPGNGKNMITVGASENYRTTWSDGCNVSSFGANNAMDVIGFSSRGPAAGGRVKPEVIAPGTHIQGTASTSPLYSGRGVCDKYQPNDQIIFAASSGTSHSAPAVAGVTSLYYYWLEQEYNRAAPSPALMKAYLIAHPTYLTGVGANDTLPSNSQGYGMPDLTTGLDDTDRVLLDQSVVFDESGEVWTLTTAVADPTKPVRIVLAYTDQPGAIGTNPQVNDLNLRATIAGTTYQGNQFDGQWSVSGGTADTANNYEAIFLPPGTSGRIDLTVTAFNIAGDGVPQVGDETDQDFALVCYNCVEEPDFWLRLSSVANDVCVPATMPITVTVKPTKDYTEAVTLAVHDVPTGVVASFDPNPVTPLGESLLTLTVGETAVAGQYELPISGLAASRQHTVTTQLNVFTKVPSGSSLLLPADGAQNLPLPPSFQWTAVDQAQQYHIEIATDPLFSEIVESAIVPDTHYEPAQLGAKQRYYWRVQVINTCGEGAYSSTFSFTTAPLPGDCQIGTRPLVTYRQDFEGEVTGWSSDGIQDTWTILTTTWPQNSNHVYFAEDVSSVSDQRLVSPDILIPRWGTTPTLQFWNYQNIEAAPDRSVCYDGAILEISTNGGISWTQIEDDQLLAHPYNAIVSMEYRNPLLGLSAWCGDSQGWLNSVVDLTGYEGESVQFGFRLGTDTVIGWDGWYIDDVVVQTCEAINAGIEIATKRPQQDGEPGDVMGYTVTLTNTGLVVDTYDLFLTQHSWTVDSDLAVVGPLSPGQNASIEVAVTVGESGSDGVVVTAVSQMDPTISQSIVLTTTALRSYDVYLPQVMKSNAANLD